MQSMRKFLIDTDTAFNYAVALIMADHRLDVQVENVMIVTRNVSNSFPFCREGIMIFKIQNQ